MSRLHIIVNPAAAGNTCLTMFEGIQEELDKRGVDYSMVFTQHAGHAAELARQALAVGHEIVVSAGGDGTAREIAGELAGTSVPLGILPLGTGNDLVRSLGIPSDPIEALDLLLRENAVALDSASVNGEFFLNVSGFGFDVDVLRRTEQYKCRFHGKWAYLFGVLHALLHLRAMRVKLTSDELSLDEDVLLVAVGNGTHYGGGMVPTPLANPADGLFDVCVIRKVGPAGVLRCLARFMKGTHLELDFVRYFRTRSLSILASEAAEVQLDGEILEALPARYELRPASLRVICPPVAESAGRVTPDFAAAVGAGV